MGNTRAPKVLQEGSVDGRPSKYKEEYDDLVFKVCLLGATDERLADALNISVSTLNLWKLEYPNFSEAIRKGKDGADEEIAHALYHRAKGYSHEDTYFSTYQGGIISEQYTKHYPPDTAAAIIWLKNRQPKKWRDKQEIESSGVTYSVAVTREEAKEIAKDLENEY